jgi:hypothetical protein
MGGQSDPEVTNLRRNNNRLMRKTQAFQSQERELRTRIAALEGELVASRQASRMNSARSTPHPSERALMYEASPMSTKFATSPSFESRGGDNADLAFVVGSPSNGGLSPRDHAPPGRTRSNKIVAMEGGPASPLRSRRDLGVGPNPARDSTPSVMHAGRREFSIGTPASTPGVGLGARSAFATTGSSVVSDKIEKRRAGEPKGYGDIHLSNGHAR